MQRDPCLVLKLKENKNRVSKMSAYLYWLLNFAASRTFSVITKIFASQPPPPAGHIYLTVLDL